MASEAVLEEGVAAIPVTFTEITLVKTCQPMVAARVCEVDLVAAEVASARVAVDSVDRRATFNLISRSLLKM